VALDKFADPPKRFFIAASGIRIDVWKREISHDKNIIPLSILSLMRINIRPRQNLTFAGPRVEEFGLSTCEPWINR